MITEFPLKRLKLNIYRTLTIYNNLKLMAVRVKDEFDKKGRDLAFFFANPSSILAEYPSWCFLPAGLNAFAGDREQAAAGTVHCLPAPKEFKKADPIGGIIEGPRSCYGIHRGAFEKFSREFHDLFPY